MHPRPAALLSQSGVFTRVQDIPSLIAAAKAEQSERLGVQAKMRDPNNPDTSVVLYLQVLVQQYSH